MSTEAPRRTYRIVTTANLQPGDIIKASRRRVEHTEPHPRGVAVKLAGLTNPSVFFGTEKIGIYRTQAPAPSAPAGDARYYPARVNSTGGWRITGGHGDWYIVDRETGDAVTWVGHRTKNAAQGIADERNAAIAAKPARHLSVVR
jgi:hypothetical protein